MFRVVQADSLAEVKGEDWDRLAISDPLAGHGWLSAIKPTEEDTGRRCYLLASDDQGLAGAFACSMAKDSGDGGDLNNFLFGDAQRIARATGLGTRSGIIVQKRICRPGLTPDLQWNLDWTLLQELERLAKRDHATVCFRQVTSYEGTLRDVLRQAGYAPGLDLPLARLEIRPSWDSFADYRRDLKKTHPAAESSIRQELNRARRHGLVTEEIHDPKEFAPLQQLLSAHFQRLNGQAKPWLSGILERLKQHLGDRAMIVRGSIQGTPISVCVGIRAGASASFPMIGVDPQRSRASAAYFNVGYNYQIQRCVEQKMRVANFGTLVYKLKVRRGCNLDPTQLFVRHANSLAQVALQRLLRLRSARIIQKHDLAAMGFSSLSGESGV